MQGLSLEDLLAEADRQLSGLGKTDLLQSADKDGENIHGYYSNLAQMARSGLPSPLGRQPGMLLCDSINRVLEQLRMCAPITAVSSHAGCTQ